MYVHCRQKQELESRFNEAYSQSLSMKDERIQVLERRMEDLVSDNEQLKDEVSLLRRQNERFQRRNSSGGSPNTSFRYTYIHVYVHVHMVCIHVYVHVHVYMHSLKGVVSNNNNTQYAAIAHVPSE